MKKELKIVKEFLEGNKWSGIVINDNGYSIDSIEGEECIILNVRDGGNIPFVFIIGNEDQITIEYDETFKYLINTIHIQNDTYFMDMEQV